MSALLLLAHVAYLVARAVLLSLAEQRGCRSLSHKQARSMGFRGPKGHPLDGLLLPIHWLSGRTSAQLRLDIPIPDRKKPGKVHRYLNLPGQPAKGVDVHPSMRERLEDPSAWRFLTEGIAKGDHLTGAGYLALTLTGVWMGIVKQADGSYQLHPDLEQAALPGSVFFMAFDNDAMTKRDVHDALRVTSSLLRARGCLVLFLTIPTSVNGQEVKGIDDYGAAGGSIADRVEHATTELPRLEGSDSDRTCRDPNCPERPWRKLLQRERIERVQLHAVPNLDPAKKLLGERMWSDLRYAASRGVAYRPTNAHFVRTTGLSHSSVKQHIGPVREALGVTVESRTYPPGYRFPSGKIAQNHITERTSVPPADILERDLVKSLRVLVRAEETRGGDRLATLTANPCEQHPDSQGELIRTVVCQVGREPLARLKPITVALRRPLTPEGAKLAPSEDQPLPEAPSPFRPLHTNGVAALAPSGHADQVSEIYQRARERMNAQLAASAPSPSPLPAPDDPLVQLEAEPWFAELDFASKNRERERVRLGTA